MRWPSGGVRLPRYPHHFISLFGVRPCCCSWLDHALRDRISRPHVDSWAVNFTGRQFHGPSNSWAVKFMGRQNSCGQWEHARRLPTGVRGWCADPPMRPASVASNRHDRRRNCDAPSISAEQDGAWVGGLTDPMLAKGEVRVVGLGMEAAGKCHAARSAGVCARCINPCQAYSSPARARTGRELTRKLQAPNARGEGGADGHTER
jgi:hypothetical protein